MTVGDEQAYRTFYDAYLPRLSRYLLVATSGNEAAMRDALQGTFVRVVRHIRVFTDEAVFWSWLTVLARSALADDRRKRRRYFAFLDRFRHHEPDAAEPTPFDLECDGLPERLQKQLALLPPDERQLLEWKYLERRPVRAIAAELRLSEKAIESRLTRLRRKLKDAIAEDLRDEPPH